MIKLSNPGLDPYRGVQSAPAKGHLIMDKSEGRTTWKLGEWVISYERNISSMMLVDMPASKRARAASPDAAAAPNAALADIATPAPRRTNRTPERRTAANR